FSHISLLSSTCAGARCGRRVVLDADDQIVAAQTCTATGNSTVPSYCAALIEAGASRARRCRSAPNRRRPRGRRLWPAGEIEAGTRTGNREGGGTPKRQGSARAGE